MYGGDHKRRKFVLNQLATSLRHFERLAQQALGRSRTEANDRLRLHHTNLRLQPWATRIDFDLIRLLVDASLSPWLPLEVLHGIRDIDVLAINSGGFKGFIKDLPGWPNKRLPCLVFLIARLFSYKHDSGMS